MELLKVNPGTQIPVAPSLSRDTQHTHSLIEPPGQIGVNEFFFLKFQKSQEIRTFEIVKVFYSFLRIERYVEIRYLITSFQSYKFLNLSLLVCDTVAQSYRLLPKKGKH